MTGEDPHGARTPQDVPDDDVTLGEWLRDVLDDKERSARAATPGTWRWDGDEFLDGAECSHDTEWCNHGPTLIADGGEPVLAGGGGYEYSALGVLRADAEHIARQDPATVLAGIAADRLLLDEHAPEAGDCRVCAAWADAWYREGQPRAAWPCRTVRILAARYARLPGYRAEWGPR